MNEAAKLTEQLKAANKAILYALLRIRDDANIRYHMGAWTEAYSLLRSCYATGSGKTNDEIDALVFNYPLNEKPAAPVLQQIQSAFSDFKINAGRGVNSSSELIEKIEKALNGEDKE